MQTLSSAVVHNAAVALKCSPRDPRVVSKGGDNAQVREAIRRFMKARGLNAHAWTQAAGIPHSTLYNFLRGDTRSMTEATLSKLAGAAHTDVGTMLGLDRRFSVEQQRAAEIAGRLDEKVLDAWLEMGTRMAEQRAGLSEEQRPFRQPRRGRRSG